MAQRAVPDVVGCDLELVEPRSGAFIREWLAPAEQRLLAAHPEWDPAHVTNRVWTAKEAAAQVRREGLRLDVWRAGGGWVMSIAGDPAPSRPKGAR